MARLPAAPGIRRRLAWCGLLAPIVFTGGWWVAAGLQSGYSARRDDVSALAAMSAPRPWLGVGVICATGALLLAFGVALALDRSAWPILLAPLVALAGGAVLAAGNLRIDCSPDTSSACRARAAAGLLSWHHRAHAIVIAAALAALVVGALLVAADGRMAPAVRAPALLVSLASVALFLAFRLDLAPAWRGVLERAAATLPLLWVAALAARILGVARSGAVPARRPTAEPAE